jgi:hypothetical protein
VILGRVQAQHAQLVFSLGRGCRRWHAQLSVHLLHPQRECCQLLHFVLPLPPPPPPPPPAPRLACHVSVQLRTGELGRWPLS